ncbi:MAG: holo-ACP synthase [Bacilli bacterium]|jgi:holo-[acyl-carrier protein] synthase|nr:holo-ACP synthase [Bacilli bacterium]
MIGTDIVCLKRIEETSSSFAKRILSEREQAEMSAHGKKDEVSYLGGRWAGKEAFVKASGLLQAKMKDIEILNDHSGKPHLYYKGEEVGEISISHDDYALAFVILNPGFVS